MTKQEQTNAQKMRTHLQAAEQADTEVALMESGAMTKVVGIRNLKTRAYRLKMLFEDDNHYKQRCGARDHHVSMATMYGLAALLDREEQPMSVTTRVPSTGIWITPCPHYPSDTPDNLKSCACNYWYLA